MFLSQNSFPAKYSLLLLAIATLGNNHVLDAQNRYGAAPDLSYQINAVKGELDATTQRVGKLEGEMDSLKLQLGYRNTNPSTNNVTSENNPPERITDANGIRHSVVAGDTLSSISRRYRVGVDRLVAENHITNPNTLRIGQEILIPAHKGPPAAPKAIPFTESGKPVPGKTHTVRAGDTLSSISRDFGVTSTSIAIANRLLDPNAIHIGQQLKIPSESSLPSLAKQQDSSKQQPPAPKPEPTASGEMIAPEGYGFYQIEPGDTLHSIAISFGTNPDELRILNDFSPTNSSLRIGDYLLVPVPDESLYES
ncbi:MAG: LysM peptidoglycan-binding domain-containing protein [Verrucomicrobiales bacterium]